MKRFVYVMMGLFTVTIASILAFRMTADAMAVIIGIILGMVATVPTSLLLFYMLRQRETQPVDPRQQQYGGHYPPVVVVNPPGQQNGYSNSWGQGSPSSLPAPGERSFKVVGQEASTADSEPRTFDMDRIWE